MHARDRYRRQRIVGNQFAALDGLQKCVVQIARYSRSFGQALSKRALMVPAIWRSLNR